MVCVAFAMMMAVPMMTQGFWHRFLGITSAPLRNSSFDFIDAYNDNLWPHGPNLVGADFKAASETAFGGYSGTGIIPDGSVEWKEIEYEENRREWLPVVSNTADDQQGSISFSIPIDRSQIGRAHV